MEIIFNTRGARGLTGWCGDHSDTDLCLNLGMMMIATEPYLLNNPPILHLITC